jgi:hypothetical protein
MSLEGSLTLSIDDLDFASTRNLQLLEMAAFGCASLRGLAAASASRQL